MLYSEFENVRSPEGVGKVEGRDQSGGTGVSLGLGYASLRHSIAAGLSGLGWCTSAELIEGICTEGT